jgi:hypothetical protein
MTATVPPMLINEWLVRASALSRRLRVLIPAPQDARRAYDSGACLERRSTNRADEPARSLTNGKSAPTVHAKLCVVPNIGYQRFTRPGIDTTEGV